MKNLKISLKLLISYAVVLLLLVACIVVGVAKLRSTQAQVTDFYNGPFTTKGSSNIIKSNFESLQKSIYRAVVNDDAAIMQEAFDDAETALANIEEQLPIVQKTFTGDMSLVTNMQEDLNELKPHNEQVLQMAKELRNTEAADYMENNNIPVINNATKELDAIISFANNEANILIRDLDAAQTLAVILLIIMGIVSVLICIIFGTYIVRSIVRPVSELQKATTDLSIGKLDTEITYHSKDELGNLAENMRSSMKTLSEIIQDIAFLMSELSAGNFTVATQRAESYVGEFLPVLASVRDMRNNLSNTISQISRSADQVSSGSDQVSSGAQALSQGATEQASAVEELAATITEISNQVRNSASNASEASAKANSVGNEMVQSNLQMQEMIKAMNEISSSSGEIGKIIKTIEDIAFQTNILALNAAVEAARAGTSGKGFAVVADEVRSLAGKSAEASKNTSSLIESSLKAVENGTRIANQTASSLIIAVDGAKEVTATINKISLAANEQAGSISQVTQGVDQISSVVQTNSATAEESAAASQQLSSQATMLKSLVERFRLSDSAPSIPGGKEPAASYSIPENSRPSNAFLPSYSNKY